MTPTPHQNPPEHPDSRALKTLLIACAATVVLWFVPIASLALYPLRIFVTYIHEFGHALAAILTGGSVQEIFIHPDTSGLTYTFGGFQTLIDMAGYLGATAYGAALLSLSRRPGAGKILLAGSGILVIAISLLFIRPWHNLFGWGLGLIIGGGLLFASKRLSPRAAEMTAMFLAVQCAVNALFDLRTLVGLSEQIGTDTDAVNMSHVIPLPPIVWALLWSALSLALLAVTLRPYWRRRL